MRNVLACSHTQLEIENCKVCKSGFVLNYLCRLHLSSCIASQLALDKKCVQLLKI
ncbi:yippee-like isoform 2-T12 [Glossina fuscipes fuscipes]